jgi:uncharacterized membrane protein
MNVARRARGARIRYSRDQSEFDRAIAFFDATYAVALTLLVTSLSVSDPGSSFKNLSALGHAVGAQFFAFLIAFAVIAGYWLLHYRMVARFIAIDMPTIAANLCLIAAVVLLPFSSSAVGDPGVAGLPLPTVLMAINVAALSVLHTAVWIIADRGGLLDHTPTERERFDTLSGGLVPAAVFLVSVPIAYLAAPGIARLCWLSVFVAKPVVSASARRLRRTLNDL